MGIIRAAVPAIAVGFAVLAPAGLSDRAPGACIGASPRAAVRLPAPITISTGLGGAGYRIECDGRVRPIHVASSWPFPSDAAWEAEPGVWWAIRHGHLVVARERRVLWRSRGMFSARYGVGAIELGTRTIAFSYGNNLFLAPYNGVERLIGRAEYALGFTRGGLYAISWIRGLTLRSDTGRIVERFAHWPANYFAVGGRLFFIARGAVMTASGARVRRLASLPGLGLSADTWLQPLGPLLALQDSHRLVILRANGRPFARTPIPSRFDSIVALTVAPRARAVAFAAPTRAARTETVYVLRKGWNAAVPVLTERNVPFPVCAGGGASLQWRRNWLLYSSSEDRIAAIDTSGSQRVIELSRLVAGLPGTRHGISAYWAG